MATDRVTVCIPWRYQPDRFAAYSKVIDFWGQTNYNIVTADGDHDKPFQLSQARNLAVKPAGYGVVIIADADTIPELPVIEAAVQLVADADPHRGRVVYPFSRYIRLPASALTLPAEALPAAEQILNKRDSVGGIIVTDVATYWRIGGMDERFERCWGFEDNAFHAAAETLSEVVRLPGRVYSFDHDVEGIGRDWSELNPNFYRNELYQFATTDPRLMRELIKR